MTLRSYVQKTHFGLSMFMLLAVVLFMAPRGYAQVAGATLSGTINDSSRAVIPNAQVAVRSLATDVTRTVSTDNAGFYTVPNLLPGQYSISVTASGFATETQSGVILTVGAQQVLNFSMHPGQVTETVEVTTQAPVVQLTSSTISDEVNSTTVRELPLNGRDWTSLATLQPGITSMSSTQPAISISANATARGIRGFGNQLSISGARPGQNNYRLDGISENDYSNSSPGSVLGGSMGVEAISEFSVLTSNYSAEYGRTSGGVVNAISRSGTNQFHGSAYDFLRNNALDARNFFDPAQIPPFRRNQFGVSGGGPIRKDHTFIFANFEEINQSLGITAQDNVPSLAADSGLLNFANSTQFPTGASACVANGMSGVINNQPYVQCALTVHNNIKPFLGLWRAPNAGLLSLGNTGIYSFASQQATTERFLTARVDHKFSDTDSIDGSFQWDRATTTLPDDLNDILVGEKTGHNFISIEENHIFSPRLINSFRVGFNRSTALTGGGISAINPASADLSLSSVMGWDAADISAVGLASYNGGLNSANNAKFAWNSYQLYDDASMTRGIHSFRFGFATERMQDNYIQYSRVGGAVTFGSLAGFLTDVPSKFQVTLAAGIMPRGLRQSLYAGYVQDDIHWKPNLTFNVGLRYEVTSAPTEVQGRLGRLLTPTSPTVTVGNPFFGNSTLHNFEPRVGFAWDPFKNGKTSIRGGFGLFDVLPLAYEYSNFANNSAPFAPQGNVSNLPQGSFPSGALAIATKPGALRVSYVDPNPRRNYVEQWNFSIQRELLSNLTATVAYAGSHGVHMEFRADDMNMVIPTLTPAGYLWPAKIGSGTVLNPNFGRIDDTDWGADSSYHSLQLLLMKRMSHGIQIQGSYTWSKSIDEGSGAYLADPFANSIPDLFWFDKGLRRSVSDYNIAQNLSINYAWVVPTPKMLPAAATWALGGWQLGGIVQARTGLPFTPVLGGDPLGTNATEDYDFPNRLRGPGCESGVNPGNPNSYINLACFAPASPINLLGNAGRNSLIGPGLLDFDFSAFKNNYIPKISESFNVQFRAELFNVFNRANFNSPTDTNSLFDQTGAPVAGAGRIDATSTTAREIQFALKVIW